MSNTSAKSIKERIKRKRTQYGYTQKMVADYCGVSVSTVKNWESGETSPTGPELVSLSHLFHTSPNYLLLFEEKNRFIVENTSFEEEQLMNYIHEIFKGLRNGK